MLWSSNLTEWCSRSFCCGCFSVGMPRLVYDKFKERLQLQLYQISKTLLQVPNYPFLTSYLFSHNDNKNNLFFGIALPCQSHVDHVCLITECFTNMKGKYSICCQISRFLDIETRKLNSKHGAHYSGKPVISRNSVTL